MFHPGDLTLRDRGSESAPSERDENRGEYPRKKVRQLPKVEGGDYGRRRDRRYEACPGNEFALIDALAEKVDLHDALGLLTAEIFSLWLRWIGGQSLGASAPIIRSGRSTYQFASDRSRVLLMDAIGNLRSLEYGFRRD